MGGHYPGDIVPGGVNRIEFEEGTAGLAQGIVISGGDGHTHQDVVVVIGIRSSGHGRFGQRHGLAQAGLIVGSKQHQRHGGLVDRRGVGLQSLAGKKLGLGQVAQALFDVTQAAQGVWKTGRQEQDLLEVIPGGLQVASVHCLGADFERRHGGGIDGGQAGVDRPAPPAGRGRLFAAEPPQGRPPPPA